jgi:hypothetical protein
MISSSALASAGPSTRVFVASKAMIAPSVPGASLRIVCLNVVAKALQEVVKIVAEWMIVRKLVGRQQESYTQDARANRLWECTCLCDNRIASSRRAGLIAPRLVFAERYATNRTSD